MSSYYLSICPRQLIHLSISSLGTCLPLSSRETGKIGCPPHNCLACSILATPLSCASDAVKSEAPPLPAAHDDFEGELAAALLAEAPVSPGEALRLLDSFRL